MSKKIIVVDDHNLFAQSLRKLIQSFDGYEVLEVLQNGKELVDYFESSQNIPDIVLLDIRMPVMDGIDTMAWLKNHCPNQKVLALTMEHDEEIIIQMVKLGCRGYLLKDIEPDEFLLALNCVLNSGYYLNDDTSAAMYSRNSNAGTIILKEREKEFLSLVCSERTYKEVALEMNLSPKTIDGYRETLFNKLEVKSRVGLVLYAIKNKIVAV